MSLLSASFIAAGAAAAVISAGSLASAAPAPGSGCGANSVVTDNHSCSRVNSPCTGYDMMVIGRVDGHGHCVIPGMNGTTW